MALNQVSSWKYGKNNIVSVHKKRNKQLLAISLCLLSLNFFLRKQLTLCSSVWIQTSLFI